MIAEALALTFVGTQNLVQFAQSQWRNERGFEIQDAYKWLYQATLGAEHAMDDYSGLKHWMDDEWHGLSRESSEPLEVWLTPDGSLRRINLRPYKKAGGDPDMLSALFFESGTHFHRPKSEFIHSWKSLGEILRQRRIGHLRHADWKRLDRATGRKAYPAIDHSKWYIHLSHPAYRVILGSLWLPNFQSRGHELLGDEQAIDLHLGTGGILRFNK